VQAFDVNAVDYVLKRSTKHASQKRFSAHDANRIGNFADRSSRTTSQSPRRRANRAGKPSATAPSKILVNAQQRLLLVDAEDMIFATISTD